MMRIRALFLAGFTVILGAASLSAAPESSAPTGVRAELLSLLQTDAKSRPQAPGFGAAAAPVPQKVEEGAVPSFRPSPTATIGEPFRPQLWTYFTDTGVLASKQGKRVTQMLTFGPCTSGELLNQRFYW